jgi:hypothetical protein
MGSGEKVHHMQTSIAEGRPATAWMPELVEMPTAALASAGTPIAQYGRQQLTSFRGNSGKTRQTCEKKRVKNPYF